LILSPTRELAEQICRELEPLAKAMDRKVLAVYGGTGLDRQIRALRKGVDVLVACPGRLLDLISQRAVDLGEVDIVVVDEADRMADMGFLPDVRELLDQTSDIRQTVMFSATLDRDVQVLTDKYQNDPVVHEVGEVEPDLSTMEHRFIKVRKPDRVWLAADVIDGSGPTVVFCRTRHGVDRLARQLKAEGIKTGYIHGGRSQSQRDRALQVFTTGKVDALVATDVAARGIHVDGVTCVIHYDPPADIKDYVHRSGRTARAGAVGVVVSFLDGPQVKESQKMQRKLGLEAELEDLPERQPRSSRPAAVDDRRAGSSPGRSRKAGEGHKAGKGHKAGSGKAGRGKAGKARNGAAKAGTGSKPESASDSPSRSRSKSTVAGRSTSPSSGSTASSASSKRRRDSGSPPGKRTGGTKSSRGPAGSSRSSGGRPGSHRSSAGRPGAEKSRASGSSSGGTKRASGTSGGAAGKSGGAAGKSGGAAGKSGGASGKSGGAAGKSGGTSGKSGERNGVTGSSRSVSGAKPSGKKRPAKAGARKGAKTTASRNGAKNTGPQAKKSKRSGKPRPKNRKNKPKASGRK
jgi:superfamily II DNA/RNA helicase